MMNTKIFQVRNKNKKPGSYLFIFFVSCGLLPSLLYKRFFVHGNWLIFFLPLCLFTMPLIDNLGSTPHTVSTEENIPLRPENDVAQDDGVSDMDVGLF